LMTFNPAMNDWAIVIASLRDFAAFAPFARNDFKRPLPRSSTPNCLWPRLYRRSTWRKLPDDI